MIQKVYELNDDEVTWRNALLAVLEEDLFVRGDLAAMDEFFTGARQEWYAQPVEERPDPNPTVCVIGAGIGEILAARLDLSWGIIEDEQGSEMGLHGDPGGIVVLPLSGAGKMWVEGGSVADFTNQVTEQVLKARAAG